MPPAFTIGLDLGTTTIKAVAATASGEVLAVTSATYALHTPHPRQAEQHADEVWQGAVTALSALAPRLPPAGLAGLAISGAMHSVLPVSAQGTPLAPALTWADQRATAQLAAARAATDPLALYARTGCPLQSSYHIPKLRWWVEREATGAPRAALYVLLKDYVLFRLTGQWASDQSLASTTGLLAMDSLAWECEALALAGVQPERLPPLCAPTQVVGGLTGEAAALTGLPAGLPVVAGGSDGALANLGVGVVRPGQMVITIGTSGAVRRIVPAPWCDSAARTWCYVLVEGRWFAGGAISNGGLAVQWVRDHYYQEEADGDGYARLMAEAAEVPPGAAGVRLLPYFTGERSPHWNAGASAALLGLRLAHTRAHVARAALEGVAFCLADVWAALQAAGPAPESVALTGGIVRSPIWAQILADVLGVELCAQEGTDASALGAARLCQAALGQREALDPAPADPARQTRYRPNAERHAHYRDVHAEFQALYRQLFG
jgi:gluconokinase